MGVRISSKLCPHLGRILLKRTLKLFTSKSALQDSIYGSTGYDDQINDDDDDDDDDDEKGQG